MIISEPSNTTKNPFNGDPVTYDVNKSRNIGVLLFPGFAPLDVFGPLEFLNALSVFAPIKILIISENGGLVESKVPSGLFSIHRFSMLGPTHCQTTTSRLKQSSEEAGRKMNMANRQSQTVLSDFSFADTPHLDILLIPGGTGTRSSLPDPSILKFLRERAQKAELILTICTGTAFAAIAGILDGKKATTNKWSWDWVTATGPGVEWVKEARWIQDGNILSSSGVTAGMDMTCYFIRKYYGKSLAKRIADVLEFEPVMDPSLDPFAVVHGLIKKNE